MGGLARRGRAEKKDSRDRLGSERRQAAQEYRDVRKDPSWCVDVGGGSGSRGVNVTSVVAGGDTDQAPCNLGWYACVYVCIFACTEYAMYSEQMGVLGWVGWLPCLTRCLSIPQDDMSERPAETELCCAELPCSSVLNTAQRSVLSAVCNSPPCTRRSMRRANQSFGGILPLPSSWCRAPAPNNSIC